MLRNVGRRIRSLVGAKKSAALRGRTRVVLDPDKYRAIYAIGDVHGCFDKLVAACKAIAQDADQFDGRVLAVFLGDYVDRGLHSRSVLRYLTKISNFPFDCQFLSGNHDEAFVEFCRDPGRSIGWLDLGGRETLMSYGIDADHILRSAGGVKALSDVVDQVVPNGDLDFLNTLPVMVEVGKTIFVHAGIRPGVPLTEQSDYDLMWIREPFLSRGPEFELTVIHGHTITDEPDFGPNRIGIDTGAYETGRLTAVRIVGDEISFVTVGGHEGASLDFQSVAGRDNGRQ